MDNFTSSSDLLGQKFGGIPTCTDKAKINGGNQITRDNLVVLISQESE